MNRIGKYDIARELGRGAMGIVYEGVDPYIGRKVAIKTIRFDAVTAPAEQQEAQQRFMREARSAGNLSHPSIVTIYEVGEDQGTSYIAMEFIEGESLESLIAARRRLPLDDVVELIAQIGDALDYAHRNGIVHRDIKPANILLDKEGRPKIVDFGIARITSSSMTQTNAVLGTPAYMAPEQIAGQKVDHRADLFALGAILYELLTFRRAFPGDNVTTVIYQIMNEMPPPPRTLDQSLSAGLDAVLGSALAKDPSQRYQSGRALADHLRNYRQFEHDAAGEATVPGGVEAFPGPDVDPAAATMRIEPGAFGPAQATMRSTPVADVPPPVTASAGPASPPKSRPTMALVVVGALMVLIVIAVVGILVWPRGGGREVLADASASGGTAAPDVAPVAAPALDAGTASGTPVPARPAPTATADPAAMPAASTPAQVSSSAPAGTPKPAAPASRPVPAPTAAAVRRPAPTKPADATAPAPVRSEAPSRATGRIYEAVDVDERPRVLKQVAPVYPKEASSLKLQDVVVVKALVGSGGRVEDVQILKHASKSASFDDAALNAVRQYTFAPARKKGQPVSCWFNVGVPFQLPK